MAEAPSAPTPAAKSPAQRGRVLLVDDDEASRQLLGEQLSALGHLVRQAGDLQSAMTALLEDRPEVVLLDRRLKGIRGEPALVAFKKAAPRVPVIVLTGHAGRDGAAALRWLDAAAYVEKPCEPERLGAAIAEVLRAAQSLAPHGRGGARGTAPHWLWGRVGLRPGVLLAGGVLLVGIVSMRAPAGLVATLDRLRPDASPRSAQAMLGILAVSVLYWATHALPASVTGLLVALLLYAFGVFPPTQVAAAFVSDPILMLAAVLALGGAVARSGLDRRAALSVVGLARSPWTFALLGLPALALLSSIVPGWAMVAVTLPVLVAVHSDLSARQDPAFAKPILLGCVLALCFTANTGAFGSPAGSGRNAALLAMLGDTAPTFSFAAWLFHALPAVVSCAVLIGLYWLVFLRGSARSWRKAGQAMAHLAQSRARPWTRDEVVTLSVLSAMGLMWIVQGATGWLSSWGLAGPALLAVAVLALYRGVEADTLARLSWGTVISFAAVSALAKGLSLTGAAAWLGSGIASFVPAGIAPGPALSAGILVAGAACACVLGEVASVALIGPIALAAATVLGTDPTHAVLASAFSVALGHARVIATPANAVGAALARDAGTGEPLVAPRDFLVHGSAVTVLSITWLSLWSWWGAGRGAPW